MAMSCGLYESAFSTLARIYGTDARRAITGITLIAGFASTIGWPLTAWLDASYGWRVACFAWAGAHLLIGVPLNALLPTGKHAAPATATEWGCASGVPSDARVPGPMPAAFSVTIIRGPPSASPTDADIPGGVE